MSRSLLFCFAHPDDESFAGAATAMKYAAAGIRSVLVTATRGERGKVGDPPVCRAEELGECRERELREAAAIVGFDELHILGYRDRELADAPPAEIRATLVSLIRRIQPAVVCTFDPNGFNLHPDHVAISRFTSDAIAYAADPRCQPEACNAHVVSRLLWTPSVPPWEAARLDRLETHASIDVILDVSAWIDRRAAALRAHRTQHLSVDKYFFNQPDLDRVLGLETWRHAWGPPLSRRPSDDIFQGLELER
jgi:N-acetylglucosamine malate deacetylase 2